MTTTGYSRSPDPLLATVRLRCQVVSEQATSVMIDTAALPGYVASLPVEQLALPKMDTAIHYLGHGRETLVYLMVLDTVNFGSGYFPDILKDTRRSGYRAIAAALTDYFAAHGTIPPAELSRITADDCARIFRLDRRDPAALELMGLFAGALNDLGAVIRDRYDGDFTGVVEAAGGSAERLVKIMTSMPSFNDVAFYRGVTVPFYKRAQLMAVDLYIGFDGKDYGRFDDIDQLTICADNLVPHVLMLDGILQYSRELATRIEQGEPVAAGSEEEVEIRACAVRAGELIVVELRRKGAQINAMALDNFLWHRGQEPFYRNQLRHRTRSVFY